MYDRVCAQVAARTVLDSRGSGHWRMVHSMYHQLLQSLQVCMIWELCSSVHIIPNNPKTCIVMYCLTRAPQQSADMIELA
jgi:hypothetical protein